MSVQHDQLSAISLPAAPPTSQSVVPLQTQRRIFQAVLLVSDSGMILLAFAVAYWLRFEVQLTLAPGIAPSFRFYATLAILLIPMWLGLFALFRLYDFHHLLGGTTEYSRTFNACTVGMMLVIVSTFVQPTFIVARGWLLASWLLSFLLVCGARFTLRRIVYGLRQRGYFLAPAVIVGANGEGQALAEQLRDWRRTGLRLIGLVTPAPATTEHTVSGVPVLGSLDEVTHIVQQHEIEEIIVATTAVERTELLRLFDTIESLDNVELRLSSGLFEVLTTGVQVKTVGAVPLMSLNKLRLDPMETGLKAILDYGLSAITLVCLMPLLLCIALLIKLDSRGPVLYRRRVLGVGRTEFYAYKFRTMHVDGDDILAERPDLLSELNEHGKLKDDPRITRVGQWLRRYSLDELPQLFNVLRGQMSLVGPRMITPEEAERYGRLRANLLTVKPGITGLWQVSGRSDLTYEERVRLDMHYIRNYTIWRDLQILFIQTPPAVLKARGAY